MNIPPRFDSWAGNKRAIMTSKMSRCPTGPDSARDFRHYILAPGGVSRSVAECAGSAAVAGVDGLSTRFNAAMNVSAANGLARAS